MEDLFHIMKQNGLIVINLRKGGFSMAELTLTDLIALAALLISFGSALYSVRLGYKSHQLSHRSFTLLASPDLAAYIQEAGTGLYLVVENHGGMTAQDVSVNIELVDVQPIGRPWRKKPTHEDWDWNLGLGPIGKAFVKSLKPNAIERIDLWFRLDPILVKNCPVLGAKGRIPGPKLIIFDNVDNLPDWYAEWRLIEREFRLVIKLITAFTSQHLEPELTTITRQFSLDFRDDPEYDGAQGKDNFKIWISGSNLEWQEP